MQRGRTLLRIGVEAEVLVLGKRFHRALQVAAQRHCRFRELVAGSDSPVPPAHFALLQHLNINSDTLRI